MENNADEIEESIEWPSIPSSSGGSEDESTEENNTNKEESHEGDKGSEPHSDSDKLHCDTCQKSFASCTNYKRHLKIVHTKVKQMHECPVCHETFNGKEKMLKHCRQQHRDANPFKCDQCGKGYKSVRYLKYHAKMHTGAFPWKCGVCSTGFEYRNLLDRHMAFHRNDRPFICEVCGKNFKCQSVLNKHLMIHRGEYAYTCEQCGKGFRNSVHFKEHVERHQGKLRFPCEFCGRIYSTKFYLNVHTRNVHNSDANRVGSRKYSRMKIVQDVENVQHVHIEENDEKKKRDEELAIKKMKKSKKREKKVKMEDDDDDDDDGGDNGGDDEGDDFQCDSDVFNLYETAEDSFLQECGVCGVEFDTEEELKEHELAHVTAAAAGVGNPLECHHCGKAFATIAYLKMHVRVHSNACEVSLPPMVESAESKDKKKWSKKRNNDKKDEGMKYRRSNENKTTKSGRKSKKNRVSGKNERDESERGTVGNDNNGELNAQPGTSGMWGDLNYNALNDSDIFMNLFPEVELGEGSFDVFNYECAVCKMKFKEEKEWEAHKRKHVVENPNNECIYCKKTFKTSAYLKMHVKMCISK